MEPGPERRVSAKLAEPVERANERFLREILREVRIPREPIRQPVHTIDVRIVEGALRRAIAGKAPGHELLIRRYEAFCHCEEVDTGWGRRVGFRIALCPTAVPEANLQGQAPDDSACCRACSSLLSAALPILEGNGCFVPQPGTVMEVVDRLAGQRVLTVDDSRAIRAFLLELLEPHVQSVVAAADAAEARAVVGNGGLFDLVLLDLVLPDADGMSLLRELRAIDKDCAIVMITGAGGVQSATAAVLEGADGYIEKQHLTTAGENAQFFYALAQAIEHRAGVVAARRLESMKADFYSMVTHDLRNPAGNVLVSLKLLLAGKAGPLQPRQEAIAQLAYRSAEKFVSLINDYLDYAKIDAGYLRLDPEETDLAAVARSSVEQARMQADIKRQTVTLEAPESIPAFLDATKLEQVLDNLISNSIKYTPEGGTIAVVITVDAGAAHITVSDDGVGISADQLGHLFAKYHRVPGQKTASIQGTGLGLLIIKEIVEAHGGSVGATSEGVSGKGSTFIVDIPLRAVVAAPKI